MTWYLIGFIQTVMITVCTMACIHAFLFANKAMPKDIRRLFLILTCVLLLECLEVYFDNRLALWPNDEYYYWRIFVSTIGYTLRPMMLYIVLLIMMRDTNWKAKNIVLAIPAMVTLGIRLRTFLAYPRLKEQHRY